MGYTVAMLFFGNLPSENLANMAFVPSEKIATHKVWQSSKSHICNSIFFYIIMYSLEGCKMKLPTKRIELNEAEWRLIIYALNKLRTSLINEGRYTDTVDEVMLKIINAPIKKVKAA